MVLSHSLTCVSDTFEENLIPSSQFPVPAASFSSSPLSPKPELTDVQNGITVFPVKSFALINPSTGHAAMPHQIGNSSVKYGLKKFNFLFSTTIHYILPSSVLSNA